MSSKLPSKTTAPGLNKLSSYWSESGDSCCPASCCEGEAETLVHLLLICAAYASTRAGLVQKWKSVLANTTLTRPPPYLMQFLLDATVLPDINAQVQSAGEGILFTLFSLTRTWCYSTQRERLRIIKSSKESSKNDNWAAQLPGL